MEMETQKQNYKKTNPNLFFKFSLKTIKDDLLLTQLSGSELKVLIVLATFINTERKAYPCQGNMARLCGLGKSTISRTVTQLSKKEFLGHNILHIDKHREAGNKFSNNVYTLSKDIGISFGNDISQKPISQLEHTNKNHNDNNNKNIKNNNTVISHKKKKEVLLNLENATKEDGESFRFYTELLTKEEPGFGENMVFAANTLRKNIRDHIGLENWRDFVKRLERSPSPLELLQHLRYQTSQNNLSYKEALDSWDKKGG
jgi:DNA-binding MarR family transcriptional regulator